MSNLHPQLQQEITMIGEASEFIASSDKFFAWRDFGALNIQNIETGGMVGGATWTDDDLFELAEFLLHLQQDQQMDPRPTLIKIPVLEPAS